MKKTKIALTLVCAILIVAASVMGTLAYLTATTETVTNTFSVGNVSFDGGLDEAKVNAYGQELCTDGTTVYTGESGQTKADRVTSNVYKLIPGHTYTKDPTVHMGTNTEDAYLFVTVDNGISDIETTDSTETIAAQMAALGWKEVKDTDGNVVAYVYYDLDKDGKVNTTRAKVTKDQDIVVFNTFTLADNANVNAEVETTVNGETVKVNKYADGRAAITIQAYAIQADGIATTVSDYELWTNFSAT